MDNLTYEQKRQIKMIVTEAIDEYLKNFLTYKVTNSNVHSSMSQIFKNYIEDHFKHNPFPPVGNQGYR